MSQTKVTSFYGPRNTGIAGASTNHKGLDLGGTGTTIYAVADGKVVAAGYNPVRGWYVEIQINRSTTAFYQHMKYKSYYKKGQTVKAGSTIGVKGASGLKGMSPHLHIEIRVNGSPVDPLPYFIASYNSMPIQHTIKKMKSNTETIWILEAKRLQENLKKMELYSGNIDGKPEGKTDKAIRTFQKKYKLTVDGSFGPACIKKINQLGYK